MPPIRRLGGSQRAYTKPKPTTHHETHNPPPPQPTKQTNKQINPPPNKHTNRPTTPLNNRTTKTQAGELLVAEDDSPEAGSLMPDVPIAYLAPRNVDPALLRHAFGPTPR